MPCDIRLNATRLRPVSSPQPLLLRIINAFKVFESRKKQHGAIVERPHYIIVVNGSWTCIGIYRRNVLNASFLRSLDDRPHTTLEIFFRGGFRRFGVRKPRYVPRMLFSRQPHFEYDIFAAVTRRAIHFVRGLETKTSDVRTSGIGASRADAYIFTPRELCATRNAVVRIFRGIVESSVRRPVVTCPVGPPHFRRIPRSAHPRQLLLWTTHTAIPSYGTL